MAVGKIREFDVTKGTWSSYVDRMDMFFLVNAVKEELKLPTLIAAMGDEAYELLSNLASPKKPSELKYKEAVDLLRHHLQPTPSVLAERYRFRQRRQNNDENIAGYVAELKKLARNCKFETSLNENLRDQFVCGLRSDVIRQRLFAEDDTLSYTNAVKIASSLEAAERDSAAVEPGPGTGSGGAAPGAPAAMYALASGSTARHQAPRSRSRTGGRSRSASGSARGAAGGRRGAGRGGGAGYGPGGGGGQRNCGGCGATDHDYNNCRFRGYVCSLCQRKGHLRRVCPDRAGTGRGGSAPGRLYYGQAATVADDSDRDEGATEEDFHHLCLNDYSPKNPLHTIPVFEDGDLVINNSHAILMYVADVYGKQDSFYPRDPAKRALVNQQLFFNASILFRSLWNISYYLTIQNDKNVFTQKNLEAVEEAYGFVEEFLTRHKYIAGNDLTIADIAAFTTTTGLHLFKELDAQKYPKTQAWLTELEKLPAIQKQHVKGQEEYKALIQSRLAE